MDKRLLGKVASSKIRDEIKRSVDSIVSQGNRPPHLAAILVGNDGASKSYVQFKTQACQELGFLSTLITLDDTVTEENLLIEIDKINSNSEIDGLIVQLPLPAHINENKITQAISPNKDVDGFHDINMGKLTKGSAIINPATPFGILLLMQHYNINAQGKHVVVIGRSNIVGRPLSILLSSNIENGNGTVTLCHSKSQNLKEMCLQADILVAAIGKPYFVTADMVKPGAIVIDVGTTRIDADNERGWKLAGDVDYENVLQIASQITPVPGGIGPMTITGLMYNTLLVRKMRLQLQNLA